VFDVINAKGIKGMSKNFVAVFSEIGKGGAEKVVASLVNHLVDEDYKVTIISFGPKHNYEFLEFSEKIEILHFPRKGRFDFSSFNSVRDILEDRKANFVFCVDIFSHVFISMLRLRYSLTFKNVLNIHGTLPIKKNDYVLIFIASRFLKQTDWIVFISKNQRKFLTSYFLLDAKCNKTIIYNGIDTEIFKIATPSDKKVFRHSLLKIDKDDKVIIKVAGIRIEKDHDVAIRALRYFHDTFEYKPYFVILGDGNPELTTYLKKLVDDLNLTEYVKFIGFNTNVNDFLSSSDLFTLTSNSVETFSLAALEAMACGLPAVLTNIGGADEMIQEGVNGYLSIAKDPADIANKWHKALQKDFDQQQIREFVVNKFDVETMNSNYYNFFNEIDSSCV
jgi:glycosyltransferase involved in cell wall biosynthesis